MLVGQVAVSYTHLDVYKRQVIRRAPIHTLAPLREYDSCIHCERCYVASSLTSVPRTIQATATTAAVSCQEALLPLKLSFVSPIIYPRSWVVCYVC